MSALHDNALPLSVVRVIEIAGLGPVPFAAMLLSQLGADIVRIEQPGAVRKGIGVDPAHSPMHRGRTAVALDLKNPDDLDTLWQLIESADVLLEGMRPGAAERLGLSAENCVARNARLIFARLCGWERQSSQASVAGHDINYIAEAGLLGMMGPAESAPVPPLVLGADFPGGYMLALKIVSALFARASTGRGAIVDQSLVGAAAMIAGNFQALQAAGLWPGARGANVLDGGAPWYSTYRTRDGKYVAVGALEEPFYRQLVEALGLVGGLPDRRDRNAWPAIREAFAAVFATRDRDAWTALFQHTDACVSPVREIAEIAATETFSARGLAAQARTLDNLLENWRNGPQGNIPQSQGRMG